MTEKKESILKSALELFASDGYNATSTNKVAGKAGVSEGLIFRHFKNKQGLLEAVMELGEEQIKKLYSGILLESDPSAIIRKTIEIPFSVKKKDYEFWRLQYKLKWEIEEAASDKMEPLRNKLREAFKNLGFSQNESAIEAELLVILIEGIGSSLLKSEIKNENKLKKHLLRKYNIK